jgi:hypothetical protein
MVSPGTPDYSTIKTEHHDITEILLKLAINAIPTSCWPLHYLSVDLSLLVTSLLQTFLNDNMNLEGIERLWRRLSMANNVLI